MNTGADNFDTLHRLHQGEFMARNLSAQTALELGIRILSGAYVPDELLPDEPALSNELGVSRTVVREAIKILTAKGLVEARPRLGTRILQRRNWQILDHDLLAWQQQISFGSERLLHLTELRRAIEPSAASLAAYRRSNEDLDAIERAYVEMEREVCAPDRFVAVDVRFHVSILRAARNEYFAALEGLIFAGLIASIRMTNCDAQTNRTSLPLHKGVLERVAARDSDGAGVAMTELLEDALQRLKAAFVPRATE